MNVDKDRYIKHTCRVRSLQCVRSDGLSNDGIVLNVSTRKDLVRL